MLINLWEVGSKHPVGINIEKAWNLFVLILNNEVLQNPTHMLGVREIFPDFVASKQALINAFIICPQTFGLRCKGSELFWIEQENSDFLVNFLRKSVNLFRK